MAIKWVCKDCGALLSDGQPDNPKMAPVLNLHDYKGICPLCGGPLKAYKPKKK